MDMSDAPSSPHDQMPPAHTRKRKVKKTEKARALEQNTDSDEGQKVKRRKVKKKRNARVKGIPEGESSSEDDQGGDDDVEGKIE
jgi:hypothetical protein